MHKIFVLQKFCASSWLITEINILRSTVSKTSKFLNICLQILYCIIIYLSFCLASIEQDRRNSDLGRQYVRGNEMFKRKLKPEKYIRHQGNSWLLYVCAGMAETAKKLRRWS